MKDKNLNIKITSDLQSRMKYHKEKSFINWSALITDFIENRIKEEDELITELQLLRNSHDFDFDKM
jgi:hypothetical protein